AHTLAALVRAASLGVLVLIRVDRLARFAAVGVEQHPELDHAVGIRVGLLSALPALFEQRDAVERAVVIGVGLAAHDRLAVGSEARDHVGLAVRVAVLFDAHAVIALEEDRDVELAVVVAVLLFGDL